MPPTTPPPFRQPSGCIGGPHRFKTSTHASCRSAVMTVSLSSCRNVESASPRARASSSRPWMSSRTHLRISRAVTTEESSGPKTWARAAALSRSRSRSCWGVISSDLATGSRPSLRRERNRRRHWCRSRRAEFSPARSLLKCEAPCRRSGAKSQESRRIHEFPCSRAARSAGSQAEDR